MNELFISPRGNYVYVEIGALDGILYSNTLHLHTCLGWRGVLVEGNRANYERLVINVQETRPEAEVHWGAVCAKAQGFVNFTESGGAVAGDLNFVGPGLQKDLGCAPRFKGREDTLPADAELPREVFTNTLLQPRRRGCRVASHLDTGLWVIC